MAAKSRTYRACASVHPQQPTTHWRATCLLSGVRAITPYSRAVDPSGALQPEVVDPRIADVEALARWLDYAFVLPGGFRYGLGGFLDLIPGFGDLVDAALSLYIILRAIQLGVPRVTLTRMVVNVGIETAAGAIPFLGAVFDTVFKANRRNYELLRAHVTGARRQAAKDWGFLIVTALLLVISVALPVFLIVELVKHL